MTFRSLSSRWVLALLIVLMFVGAVSACPTCKDGLAQNDPGRANMVRGYFWSILFMMSMPFLILGGLGSYFYFEIRRARSTGQLNAATLPQTGSD